MLSLLMTGFRGLNKAVQCKTPRLALMLVIPQHKLGSRLARPRRLA
jgi:hypothetical protein